MNTTTSTINCLKSPIDIDVTMLQSRSGSTTSSPNNFYKDQYFSKSSLFF